jgi:TRAP-type mannitol/chloroaromatic compound transport system permease small subunit
MWAVCNRGVARVLGALRWLALPVAALLFLQWPLREAVHVWSREANDLGQWLFALFVAASVIAATRADAHLASDAFARRIGPVRRARLARVAILLALLPWTFLLLYAGLPRIVASVAGFERFPDTGNFGYFIVKAALGVLALLILVQAVLDLTRPDDREREHP